MKLKQQILSAVMLAASTGAQATKTNFENLQADYSAYGGHFASGSFLDKVGSGPTDQGRNGIVAGAFDFTARDISIIRKNGLSRSLFDSGGGDRSGGKKGHSESFFESDTERGARNIVTWKHHSDWQEREYHYQARTRRVSPVPEQNVWILLMPGLAMIGFMAYRRRDMH